MATMTATFQANVSVTTNERSIRNYQFFFATTTQDESMHTEISWEEGYADNVEEQGDDLRNDHVDVPR